MIVLKVDILVKADTETKCKEYLRVLQENSRREPGCLMYLTHQSTENPRKFLIYEQYKDQGRLMLTANHLTLSNTCGVAWTRSWSRAPASSLPVSVEGA